MLMVLLPAAAPTLAAGVGAMLGAGVMVGAGGRTGGAAVPVLTGATEGITVTTTSAETVGAVMARRVRKPPGWQRQRCRTNLCRREVRRYRHRLF